MCVGSPIAGTLCNSLWRPEHEFETDSLGGLTPAAYGRQLVKETGTVTAGL